MQDIRTVLLLIVTKRGNNQRWYTKQIWGFLEKYAPKIAFKKITGAAAEAIF